MCEAEVTAVRGRYPHLTYLGVLIVTAHEKWCRQRFIKPLAVLSVICWAVGLLWVYRHVFT